MNSWSREDRSFGLFLAIMILVAFVMSCISGYAEYQIKRDEASKIYCLENKLDAVYRVVVGPGH